MIRILLSLVVMHSTLACGEDASESAGDDSPSVFGTADAGGSNGDGGASERTSRRRNSLRMSYTKTISPNDGSAEVVDLLMYDFASGQEYNLTEGAGVIKCARRCLINESMTWVGWLEQGAGQQAMVLKVAPIDPVQNAVNVSAVREVASQVSNFAFTTFLDPTNPDADSVEQVIYTQGASSGINENIEM